MPRRARLVLAGTPLHVTHRGNNRQRCFYEDCDRAFYLFHLRRLLPNTQCALHAYCLMTNHVHLLLTPVTVSSCARLMQTLAQLHTQYVNRTYGRTGSLWEGRFHSCVVQSEEYLLTCYRYVERNPVDAGLCATGSRMRRLRRTRSMSGSGQPVRRDALPTGLFSPSRWRVERSMTSAVPRTGISPWAATRSNAAFRWHSAFDG